MRVSLLVCAALAAAMAPGAALADDPRDPAMQDAAARARDREAVRQLNLQQLAVVRTRDAGFAEGWRAADGQREAREDYAARSSDHERAQAEYARDRARYERDMAAWRRAVAACRRGDHAACYE